MIDTGVDAPERWATIGGQDWVLTQWAPETLASTLENRWGLPGVAWLFGLGLVVLTLAIQRMCRQQGGLTAAGLATALALAGMSASLSPRPHLVTYILLAVCLSAWLRASHDLQPRWWLIPMTWLWACSHGMWFTGVLVGIAVVTGLALDRSAPRRQLGRLALVPTLSLAMGLVTPVGPGLLLAPFAVSGVGEFITEWQAPSFRELGPAVTVLMVAAVVATWVRKEIRVPWTRLLLLGLAVGWTLLSARTVALGALMIAPLVARTFQDWLGYAAEPRTRTERVSLVTSACAFIAILAAVVPRTSSQPSAVPTGFDDALGSLPAGTVVLNSYEVGGWLRWRHPSLQPVIDGMTEAYSRDHLVDYGRTVAVVEGWNAVVARWQPTVAVLPQGSSLAAALENQGGAEPIGRHNGYVLLMLAEPDP